MPELSFWDPSSMQAANYKAVYCFKEAGTLLPVSIPIAFLFIPLRLGRWDQSGSAFAYSGYLLAIQLL